MEILGHIYYDRSWFCPTCQSDCGRDDVPCDCCFDQLPVMLVPSGKEQADGMFGGIIR